MVITSLEHHKIDMCKTVRWTGISGYPEEQPGWFSFEEWCVENIEEFSVLLDHLRQCPRKFLIRGKLEDGKDLSKKYRRRKVGKVDGHILDVDQPWVMCDIDKIPIPKNLQQANLESLWEWFCCNHLPDALKGVSCYRHWSSSMMDTNNRLFKAHLFYWLSEPTPNPVLKNWAKHMGFDAKVMDSIQIHYTADARYPDFPDPIGFQDRGRFIPGRRHEVDVKHFNLPQYKKPSLTFRAAHMKGQIVGEPGNIISRLYAIGEEDETGVRHWHTPTLQFVNSWVMSVGKDADLTLCLEVVREQIKSLEGLSCEDAVKAQGYLDRDEWFWGMVNDVKSAWGERETGPPIPKDLMEPMERMRWELGRRTAKEKRIKENDF